jgi:hypothetical protein
MISNLSLFSLGVFEVECLIKLLLPGPLKNDPLYENECLSVQQ